MIICPKCKVEVEEGTGEPSTATEVCKATNCEFAGKAIAMGGNPYQIKHVFNEKMGCHDVLLQVGGIKAEELDAFVAYLKDFIEGKFVFVRRMN